MLRQLPFTTFFLSIAVIATAIDERAITLIYPPRLVTAIHRQALLVLLLLRQTSDAV
jgi:hypothetical protein